MSGDKRSEQAYKLITELASGNWEARGIPSDIGDEMDAIIVGLNMLAEELASSHEAVRLAREGLEKQVAERTVDLSGLNQKLNRELNNRKKTQESLRDSEEKFRSLFEDSPISLWDEDYTGVFAIINELRASGVTDFKDYFDQHPETVAKCSKMVKVLDVNKATLKLFQAKSKEDLLGGLDRILTEESLSVFKDELIALAEGKTSFEGELINQTMKGESIVVALKGTLVLGKGKISHRFFVSIRDITRLKETEQTLKQSNEKLAWSNTEMEKRNFEISTLSEMGNQFQACITVEEGYQIISQYGFKLFPSDKGILSVYNPSQNTLEGMTSWGVNEGKNETFEKDACWALRRGRMHLMDGTGSGIICPHMDALSPEASICLPLIAQGEILGVLTVFSKLAENTASVSTEQENKHFSEQKLQLAVALAEDISLAIANLKLREKLRLQSIRDPLTNLFNRRYMEETFVRELNRVKRKSAPLGIIMIDIDHFKVLNDNFGHEVGDRILEELGKYLLDHLRAEDIACRYGGEEFILILPDSSLENTRLRAEEFRVGVKQMKAASDNNIINPISLSLGVAEYPANGETIDALLKAADKALYKAKAKGRDLVVVAERESQKVG